MKAFLSFLLLCGFSSGFVLGDDPVFSPGVVQGNIDSRDLDEASGCGASRTVPGILYFHNDHGDSARIFAVNASDATVVAVMDISMATNHDWEDMAVGPCGGDPEGQRSCIYILDDGQVRGQDARTIYKIEEPESITDGQTLVPEQVLVYNWTETQGCTIMVDAKGVVYVIGNALGGRGMIISISPDLWGQTDPVFMDSTSFFAMQSTHHDPASGDISPDGTEVLVKNREEAYYYYPADGNIVAALTRHGFQVPLEKEQLGEAICWAADGMAYYTLSEGHNQPLYKYTREA